MYDFLFNNLSIVRISWTYKSFAACTNTHKKTIFFIYLALNKSTKFYTK